MVGNPGQGSCLAGTWPRLQERKKLLLCPPGRDPAGGRRSGSFFCLCVRSPSLRNRSPPAREKKSQAKDLFHGGGTASCARLAGGLPTRHRGRKSSPRAGETKKPCMIHIHDTATHIYPRNPFLHKPRKNRIIIMRFSFAIVYVATSHMQAEGVGEHPSAAAFCFWFQL